MSFLVLDETKNAYARFVVNNDGTLRQELLEQPKAQATQQSVHAGVQAASQSGQGAETASEVAEQEAGATTQSADTAREAPRGEAS
jgi:hypothetical protein